MTPLLSSYIEEKALSLPHPPVTTFSHYFPFFRALDMNFYLTLPIWSIINVGLSQLHPPFLFSHRSSTMDLEQRERDVVLEEWGKVEETLKTFSLLDVDFNSQLPKAAWNSWWSTSQFAGWNFMFFIKCLLLGSKC